MYKEGLWKKKKLHLLPVPDQQLQLPLHLSQTNNSVQHQNNPPHTFPQNPADASDWR